MARKDGHGNYFDYVYAAACLRRSESRTLFTVNGDGFRTMNTWPCFCKVRVVRKRDSKREQSLSDIKLDDETRDEAQTAKLLSKTSSLWPRTT